MRRVSAGIREMAFVHAISSAGVAHAVTRACSTGLLDRCGCDKTVGQRNTIGPGAAPRRGVRGVGGGGGGGSSFQWAGCSDNAAYGSAFAKLFIDAREKAKGKEASRALMNMHNNNAGRKVQRVFIAVIIIISSSATAAAAAAFGFCLTDLFFSGDYTRLGGVVRRLPKEEHHCWSSRIYAYTLTTKSDMITHKGAYT